MYAPAPRNETQVDFEKSDVYFELCFVYITFLAEMGKGQEERVARIQILVRASAEVERKKYRIYPYAGCSGLVRCILQALSNPGGRRHKLRARSHPLK